MKINKKYVAFISDIEVVEVNKKIGKFKATMIVGLDNGKELIIKKIYLARDDYGARLKHKKYCENDVFYNDKEDKP